MNADGLQVRYKVWLERGGQVALSDWRVQLLEEIDRHGSLAEAARHIGVPYKTAWYKLKEMEKSLGEALLTSASGGPKGGGATLGTFASLGLGGVIATQLWHHLYLGGGLCDLPRLTHEPAVAPATTLAVA